MVAPHRRPRRAVLAIGMLAAVATALGATDAGSVLDVSGLTFVGSRGSRNELVLRAETARFHPDRDVAYLNVVHAVVHRDEQTPGVEITCDRAELDLARNDFRADGRVRGSTATGRRFASEWVEYHSEEGLLFTDAPVVIEEATGTLRGGGFRYHVREQRFELLGGASMVQEPAR